jgi:hypothetical protein
MATPYNTGVASGREFEDYSGNENDGAPINSPTLTGEYLETSGTTLVYMRWEVYKMSLVNGKGR